MTIMRDRSSEWAKNFIAAFSGRFIDGVASVRIPEHIRAQNYRAGALVTFRGEKDDNALLVMMVS